MDSKSIAEQLELMARDQKPNWFLSQDEDGVTERYGFVHIDTIVTRNNCILFDYTARNGEVMEARWKMHPTMATKVVRTIDRMLDRTIKATIYQLLDRPASCEPGHSACP